MSFIIKDLARAARDEVTFVTNVVTFALNVVTFDSQEVSPGSHAFTRVINTTLSEAVRTTSASDVPFFTTEQVTSVAEEIIGDASVMFLLTINKQTQALRTGKSSLRFSQAFGRNRSRSVATSVSSPTSSAAKSPARPCRYT